MRIPKALMAAQLLTTFSIGHNGGVGPSVGIDLTKKLDVPWSFRDNIPMRQFTIKGVMIKARNKKTAEKIYRIHHNKSQTNG